MYRSDLLQDKTILITGGGTGLGKAMGRRFLELGAGLVICGRRRDVLAETAAEFEADFPGRTRHFQCDIRVPDAIEEMLDAVWAETPVNGLVNNAAGNFMAKSETLSYRALDAVLGIVLHGSGYMTLGCGKRWIEDGTKASVLSIVTTYSWTGSAYVLPSVMGKSAIWAMTRSLAVEWGPKGIRLNSIAPGAFPTEGAWSRLLANPDLAEKFETYAPLGRFGDHAELTNLAVYLMSDEAGFVTGECVTIDGGAWLRGAGQFTWVGEEMSDDDWAAMAAKR